MREKKKLREDETRWDAFGHVSRRSEGLFAAKSELKSAPVSLFRSFYLYFSSIMRVGRAGLGEMAARAYKAVLVFVAVVAFANAHPTNTKKLNDFILDYQHVQIDEAHALQQHARIRRAIGDNTVGK